jgi:hypothetical protein
MQFSGSFLVQDMELLWPLFGPKNSCPPIPKHLLLVKALLPMGHRLRIFQLMMSSYMESEHQRPHSLPLTSLLPAALVPHPNPAPGALGARHSWLLGGSGVGNKCEWSDSTSGGQSRLASPEALHPMVTDEASQGVGLSLSTQVSWKSLSSVLGHPGDLVEVPKRKEQGPRWAS